MPPLSPVKIHQLQATSITQEENLSRHDPPLALVTPSQTLYPVQTSQSMLCLDPAYAQSGPTAPSIMRPLNIPDLEQRPHYTSGESKPYAVPGISVHVPVLRCNSASSVQKPSAKELDNPSAEFHDTQTATQYKDFYDRPPALPAMPRLCQTETSPAQPSINVNFIKNIIKYISSEVSAPPVVKPPLLQDHALSLSHSTPNPYPSTFVSPPPLLPCGSSTPGVVQANPEHTGYQAKEHDSDDDVFFKEHNSGFIATSTSLDTTLPQGHTPAREEWLNRRDSSPQNSEKGQASAQRGMVDESNSDFGDLLSASTPDRGAPLANTAHPVSPGTGASVPNLYTQETHPVNAATAKADMNGKSEAEILAYKLYPEAMHNGCRALNLGRAPSRLTGKTMSWREIKLESSYMASTSDSTPSVLPPDRKAVNLGNEKRDSCIKGYCY